MKSSANKDFSHQDLRGRSFKGQDLIGADFSHADIRGVSFKGAILKGANFAHAKGGMTKKSYALYMLIVLVLSALVGFLMVSCNVWIAAFVTWILDKIECKTEANINLYTLLSSIMYSLSLIVLSKKGKYSLWNISIITAVTVAISVTVLVMLFTSVASTVPTFGVIFGVIFGAFSGVSAGALAGTVSIGIAGIISLLGAIFVSVTLSVSLAGYLPIIIAVLVAIFGAATGTMVISTGTLYKLDQGSGSY